MASVKPVKNNAKVGTSTAGIPKPVANKKVSNKATVPTAKMGGKKGKC